MKEGKGSYCEELGTTAGLVLDFGIFYFKWLALYLMLSLCFTFSFYYLYLIMGTVSSRVHARLKEVSGRFCQSAEKAVNPAYASEEYS